MCGDIIKPACTAATWPEEEKERSYARMVRAKGEAGVGTATVFASHAWTFVFEELIESLKFFEEQQLAAGQPPSFFWLDIFVVDENAAHTYPSEWWQTSFTEAVRQIGHTALVLTPWRSPVPLRRAWCLWEIYSTLGTKAKLSVCMSETEMSDFKRALIESVESVVNSLCTIDAETAEAGSQKDLDMIFAAVRTLEGGFQTLNVTVLQEMRDWLLDSIARALAAVGLRFEAKPVEYRTCCYGSSLDGGAEELWDEECDCHDREGEEDQRLRFGNWWQGGSSLSSVEGECSICNEHYEQLSRMQKRKFRQVKSVTDFGVEAAMYEEKEHLLVGEVLKGKEDEAASILVRFTAL